MYMSNVNAIGAFRPRGGITPSGYILDLYPGASAAYSLRKLKASTNAVVRVVRSNDLQQRDFTSYEVLNGDVGTWVGAANDGRVVIWYDQTGNGNHATSPLSAFYPLIASKGVQVTEGGIPMVNFESIQANRLTLTTPIPYTNSVYTFFGNGTKINTANSSFLGGDTGSFQLMYSSSLVTADPLISAQRQGQADLGSLTLTVPTGHFAISCRVNETNPLYVANTTSGSGTSAGTFTQPIQYVGAVAGSADDFQGKMGDWILYDTDQWTNQPAIQANINSYYSIY